MKPKPTHPAAVALNELDDPREALRYLVGAVVLASAELDQALVHLLLKWIPGGPGALAGVWGESGGPLTRMLSGQRTTRPEAAGIADRYARLYEQRNAVVHGLLFLQGEEGQLQSIRMSRVSRRNVAQFDRRPSELFHLTDTDVQDLHRLRCDLEDLYFEVIALEAAAAEPPQRT